MRTKYNLKPKASKAPSVEQTNTDEQQGFSCLPTAVLKEPPLRRPNQRAGLSVFEFVVAGTVLMVARSSVYTEMRHDAGLAGGKRAMDNRRDRIAGGTAKTKVGYQADGEYLSKKKFKAAVGQALQKGFKPAGSNGFTKARDAFRLDEPLILTISHAELLRLSGRTKAQTYKTANRAKL
jgi:hypothetical protein